MDSTNKYVAWFVNRERQHRGFLKMLAGEVPKRIMLVTAGEGMGKTWLIQRMYHDCSSQAIPAAKFNFRDGVGRDTLEIVRKARDELGAPHYNLLTQVINDLTGGRIQVNIDQVAVSVSDSTLQNASITVDDRSGQIVGPVVDRYDVVQVDNEQMEAMIDARINDAFFACLKQQTESQRAVFLLDSFEQAQPEARRWVEEELLQRVHDGRLPNLIIIVTSRTAPGFNPNLADSIAATDLAGFDESHIREYIERRDALTILEKHENFIQLVLDINAHNNPEMLARMVDGYMLTAKEEDDDDWLL